MDPVVPGSRCPKPSCELSSWRSRAGSSPGSGERAAMWSLVPVALSGSLPLAVCFGQGRGGLLPDPSKLSVFMEPHVRSARPCPQTVITCGGTTPATPPTHSLPPASPLPASAGSSENKGGVGLPNPHCPRRPHTWRQESHEGKGAGGFGQHGAGMLSAETRTVSHSPGPAQNPCSHRLGLVGTPCTALWWRHSPGRVGL